MSIGDNDDRCNVAHYMEQCLDEQAINHVSLYCILHNIHYYIICTFHKSLFLISKIVAHCGTFVGSALTLPQVDLRPLAKHCILSMPRGVHFKGLIRVGMLKGVYFRIFTA